MKKPKDYNPETAFSGASYAFGETLNEIFNQPMGCIIIAVPLGDKGQKRALISSRNVPPRDALKILNTVVIDLLDEVAAPNKEGKC